MNRLITRKHFLLRQTAMEHTATFPSNGFGYILGTCLADSTPIALLLGRRVPEVHYPFPISDTKSFIQALSETETNVDIYTDENHSWVEKVGDNENLNVEKLERIPGPFLVTDSFIVKDRNSAVEEIAQTTGFEGPILVAENPRDRFGFLRQKFGIK